MQGGKFITIDGANGAGKTTLAMNLAAKLQDMGIEVIVIREPGGTEIGEEIRELVQWKRSSPESQALLCAAARIEVLSQVVKPALAEGKWVIADRFTPSTWVYQHYLGGAGYVLINVLNRMSSLEITIDMSFVLHCSLETLRECMGDDKRGYRGMPDEDLQTVCDSDEAWVNRYQDPSGREQKYLF